MLLFQVYRGKRLAEEKLSLGDAVFSHSVEAIAIADAEPKFIDVNEAFAASPGIAATRPSATIPACSSGRYDRLFYEAMWGRLLATGSWGIWNRRKNGDIYPALLSIVAVKNDKAEIALHRHDRRSQPAPNRPRRCSSSCAPSTAHRPPNRQAGWSPSTRRLRGPATTASHLPYWKSALIASSSSTIHSAIWWGTGAD